MSKNRNSNAILSPDNQSLAFRMYAEGHIAREIIAYFDKEKITHPNINSLNAMFKSKCHQPEIETYREAYYSRIKDVPISRKRTRLEMRDEIIQTLKRSFRAMIQTDGSVKPKEFKKFMSLVKRVEEVLMGAQAEMEKRPGMVVAIAQNFGDRELSMEELLVEERNIVGRIGEFKTEGISLPDRKA